ncbi:MAG: mannose-1-phosphate guanylyltransferase/mannose-6-phosphate isomerase [Bdellovibrionaceae bacterium]|nr:mannose-1-phosphate guanylyltransferase/mannose-6-phosphate isomerase [Pseudobdellovibrionaceae bacterium]
MNLIPIILSGGSGTRLWPISRVNYPKQFCQLLEDSLQTLTFKRLKKYQPPVLVTSEKLITLTEKEIAEQGFKVQKTIYETESKNTAPAVALACHFLASAGLADSVCGVFSSDALIADQNAFEKAVEIAAENAKNGQIVVLGIKPDRIETGFGYIQVDGQAANNQVSKVLRFHEKPDFGTAKKFVDDGHYFWNAGIFIFKVEKMIELFKVHQPAMWDLISQVNADHSNLKDIYQKVQSISLDYAIIEKLKLNELSCIPCEIGWSDLGSWDVLDQVQKNGSSAVDLVHPHLAVESKNLTVFSNEKKVYGFVGLQDLIVVDTADATLICKKGESQKVKDLVEMVKTTDKKIIEEHVFEKRPWGQFRILKDESYFKSKIIEVNAGQKISYQSHARRSEHWVLIKGEATVVLNDAEQKLKTGQHILIPQGFKHRIINNSNQTIEFIEVQTGDYFGEDDITRYEDDYGRI